MWETSGVIFFFLINPSCHHHRAANDSSSGHIVFSPWPQTGKECVCAFCPNPPLPQKGRDCFPRLFPCWKGAACISVSKFFVFHCRTGNLCNPTLFHKNIPVFHDRACVCTRLDVLSASVQNSIFGHDTLSLQIDSFPHVLRGDISMDAHHVIHLTPCPLSHSLVSPPGIHKAVAGAELPGRWYQLISYLC